MTLKDAYNYCVYFLSANGVDEAEFKALCLVCNADGIKNSEYETHKEDTLMPKALADNLWRLKCGEPLQYVLGKWDFYESEFYVGKGVLIPRPETEELTDLAVKYAKKSSSTLVYDLCSGSGCIGISIAKAVPQSDVYCVEKSADAMAYLLKNAQGIQNVHAVSGDVLNTASIENIRENSIDIIVSNPPYIKSSEIEGLQREVQFEPREALDGGADGLEFYTYIAREWKKYLKLNGILLFEIGNDQADEVACLLETNGYKNIEIKNDMYGNPRIAASQK